MFKELGINLLRSDGLGIHTHLAKALIGEKDAAKLRALQFRILQGCPGTGHLPIPSSDVAHHSDL